MVRAAAEAGLPELGISDHFALHPSGRRVSWSMAPERLGEYVAELRGLDVPASLRLRVGLEVDWYPDHDDVLREALGAHQFDYLIGSVHEVGDVVVDGSPERWRRMSQAECDEVHRGYWVNMRGLARSRLFDIAAHLDVAKKFGYLPQVNLDREIDAALDAIAEAALVVELNTSGWHKPIGDAYPTLDLLRRCRQRGIRATLSADVHQPEHLTRDYDRGLERLRAAGYDQLARFEKRQVRLCSLEPAAC